VVYLPRVVSTFRPEEVADDLALFQDSQVPPRRILVVDDKRSNAESLEVLLQTLGQEVYTAFDGKSALELARQQRPDIVLLDIGLPVMDGYEVARQCRSDAALKHLMLVAMTGYGQDSDRSRSQQAGFDAHLVKPVSLQDLLLLLKHADISASAP
jgi:CheY-like chemotaxis protein